MARKRDSGDSLDLFLDTISNAFGGLVFLALLVVILLRSQDSPLRQSDRQNVSVAELEELKLELAQGERELEALSRARSAQDRLIESLGSIDHAAELTQITVLRESRDQLLKQRHNVMIAMTESLTSAADIQAELDALTRELKKVDAEIDRARKALESEVKSRTQAAKLPVARSTTKQQVSFVLRYGRLYKLYKTDRFGFNRELNLEDFVVVEISADYVHVTPKPYAGIPVEGEGATQGIATVLDQLDRDQTYLAIAAWEDSFDEFPVVRNALVKNQFNYLLIPTAANGVVREGSGATPLVQ